MTTLDFYEHLAQIKRDARKTAVSVKKQENATDRLMRMRIENPKGLALARIDVKYQDVEAKAKEIRKKGRTEVLFNDFVYLLRQLKSLIMRMKELFGLTQMEIDRYFRKRGYNSSLRFEL